MRDWRDWRAQVGTRIGTELGLLMLATLTLGGMPQPVWAAERILLLDVLVNGYSIGQVGDFVLRDGSLLATRSELTDLGLRVPGKPPPEPGGLIDLRTLSGVTWRLDEARQVVMLVATDAALLPALLRVTAAAGPTLAIESGTGATLNYDLNANASQGRSDASGLFDLRAFSPTGVFNAGMLMHAGEGQRNLHTSSAIRLDSTYTFLTVGTQRRYRLGDFISGALAWTRPVRMGGAQIISDFSMRPDLVTFPLPSISGSAAVPSTIDVLVNGNRLLTRQIGAGPFEIPELPVVTGAGTIALTLTNALGRQVVTTLPFYASAELLAPGLQTFSAQAGVVRHHWGQLSNDYGASAASATWRRGLTPHLTIEGTAEASRRMFMAGAGAVVNIDQVALLNVAAAGSGGRSGEVSGGNSGEESAATARGTRVSVGVQRVGTRFSFGASLARASQYFRDIAVVNGDRVPRLQFSASVGISLGAFGSLGMSYAKIKQDATVSDALQPGGISDREPAQSARLLTASYSVQFRGLSLYATGFRDLDSTGISLGVSMPLGGRSLVSASTGRNANNAYAQVQAQQSAVLVGDWGYQAYAADGAAAHRFAQLQYKAPWALLGAGVDRTGSNTTLSVQSQGALSFLDGGVFATNTISDSFAVVDTNGLVGVHVLLENRIVGSTDAAGRLLVPGLRGFDLNHLAIDPADIPLDATLNVATREVRLPDKSGVVLRFAVKLSQGALLRLVDADGTPVPVGSAATLTATGASVPVGYDGEAYVEGLSAHNELTVVRADGTPCVVYFDYQRVPGNLPTIGPLTCGPPKS